MNAGELIFGTHKLKEKIGEHIEKIGDQLKAAKVDKQIHLEILCFL